jgi:hypothetical protein
MDEEVTDYRRFRRAVERRDPIDTLAAAAATGKLLRLHDSLSVVAAMADVGDERYQRAAARWAALVTIGLGLDLDGARRVHALLDAMPGTPELIGELLRMIRHLD